MEWKKETKRRKEERINKNKRGRDRLETIYHLDSSSWPTYLDLRSWCSLERGRELVIGVFRDVVKAFGVLAVWCSGMKKKLKKATHHLNITLTLCFYHCKCTNPPYFINFFQSWSSYLKYNPFNPSYSCSTTKRILI